MPTCHSYFENQLTSRPHSFALKGCIYCRQAEQFGATSLCQGCERTLGQYAPMLVQVPSDNKIFWDGKPRTHQEPLKYFSPFGIVTDQFTGQWSHATKCPTVRAVYGVIGTQQSWDAYNSYRCVALPITLMALKKN